MAKESRPGDETPPRSGRRRRRPPTLELKATEVREDVPRAEADQGQSKESARGASPKSATRSAWDRVRAQAAAGDWRGLLPAPVLTGLAGVLAGALIAYLLIPRGESIDPRVGKLTEEVSALSSRIESLASRPLPAPPPAPDQSALLGRLDKLTATIGEAERRLAAVEKRPEPKSPDLSSVNERTAGIEATLKELRTSLADLRRLAESAPEAASPKAVDTLAGRIGSLETRIAELAALRAAPPPAPPANIDLAAEIVGLNALGTAVRSGAPFVKELEAVRAVLGERAAALAPLESHAKSGLPTVDVLEKQFSDLAPRILRGPEPNGNFFERLLTNASRLVEVRPVGEPEGTSVGAVVARAETKLARRDLTGAIAEVESLPEPAKATAAKWLTAAVQRRDAESLVQNVAHASLARAKEAAKP